MIIYRASEAHVFKIHRNSASNTSLLNLSIYHFNHIYYINKMISSISHTNPIMDTYNNKE